MADDRSVIDILMQDHREVEQMFTQLESLRGTTDGDAGQRRKDLADQVIMELVKHSVAEEAEVYPRIAEKISGEEAERSKHEHAEAEETMNRLDKLRPEDPTFETELETLMREIREHVAEEENQVFVQMRQVFSEQELAEMGRKVEAVKKVAPTRPHPSAPDEPPGDKLLGPATGLFDRMRDAVTRRGTND